MSRVQNPSWGRVKDMSGSWSEFEDPLKPLTVTWIPGFQACQVCFFKREYYTLAHPKLIICQDGTLTHMS